MNSWCRSNSAQKLQVAIPENTWTVVIWLLGATSFMKEALLLVLLFFYIQMVGSSRHHEFSGSESGIQEALGTNRDSRICGTLARSPLVQTCLLSPAYVRVSPTAESLPQRPLFGVCSRFSKLCYSQKF